MSAASQLEQALVKQLTQLVEEELVAATAAAGGDYVYYQYVCADRPQCSLALLLRILATANRMFVVS